MISVSRLQNDHIRPRLASPPQIGLVFVVELEAFDDRGDPPPGWALIPPWDLLARGSRLDIAGDAYGTVIILGAMSTLA